MHIVDIGIDKDVDIAVSVDCEFFKGVRVHLKGFQVTRKC